MNNEIVNAFTVDVEDYYQVEAFSRHIDRNQWNDYASHVEANTDAILMLLEEKSTKATFFTLGCVAEKHPEIVRKIVAQGHEIASHGYSHQLIYTQDEKVFREETVRSKAILEDIAQQSVKGYRAATYSITNKSLWALDILVESGFEYDSSIFPVRHDRYGIPDLYPLPHKLKTPGGMEIVEFPISTLKFFRYNLPIAGGGYFRLFPYAFTRWALKQINQQTNEFVFYIHPWEIDQSQPIVKDAGIITKFRHYNNIDKCKERLRRLCGDFKFDTVANVLQSKQLLLSN